MPFLVPFRIILSSSSLNKNHCISVQKGFKIHSSSGDTTWVQAAAISSNSHAYTALWHSSCNYQAAQGNPYRFLARFPYRTWAEKQITLAGKLQSKPANEEWMGELVSKCMPIKSICVFSWVSVSRPEDKTWVNIDKLN